MEDITKIAENNVEIKKSKTETDTTGKDFEVWDISESYGQIRIDNEKEFAQEDLDYAKNLDAVVYKKELQDKAQAKLDTLDLIQAEMDN